MDVTSNIKHQQLSADPASPASGYSVIYSKTDGRWYIKNSDGTVIALSGVFTAEQTIGTTVTWSGTAPTGETKLYRWCKNESTRLVTAVFHGIYTSAGVTNTQVTIPLPTDMPNPLVPTGLTGASVILYTGTSLISTGITSATNAFQSTIRRNAADTGFNIIGSASAGVAAKYFEITISYFY